MNVTLSLDEKLLARARDVAKREGTTLNDMIRRHLETLAGVESGDRVAGELRQLWLSAPGHSGGRKISRDEAYEGRL
jgi:hypothetical protein